MGWGRHCSCCSYLLVQVGSTLFLSGQVGNRPEPSTQLVEGGLEAEARQIFTNLGHVLKVSKVYNVYPIEKETDRREGKGRRCCLGDGIHSIPCHTTDLSRGRS